jgi:hypothetical protein
MLARNRNTGWRIYSIGEIVALTEQRILLSQQRRAAATTFGGEFSNFTRSYAGKGVVRYQW